MPLAGSHPRATRPFLVAVVKVNGHVCPVELTVLQCAASRHRLSVPNSTSKPDESRPKTRRAGDAPTLADVARAAGVSKMTASLALNGSQNSVRVSAVTRERVMAAAEQLRYRPNPIARALSSKRTNTIGFITTLMGEKPNAYLLEVFGGVIQGAMAAQRTTTVFTLGSWDEAPTRIPAWCDGRVDGIIVLAPRLEDAEEAWLLERTPIVTVHASGNWRMGSVNFEADDEAGAYEMVQRMFALGHRNILHVGGPVGFPSADRRVEGYLRAHAAVGLTPTPVLRVPFNTAGGAEGMEDWLQRHRGQPLPEAVFGGSDAIAVGCMETLEARGLDIPRDISVVSFDHTWLGRTLHMAAVRQPLHEMGQQAVEVLVQLIEASGPEPYAGPRNIVLLPEIVMGRTLAEPHRAPLLIA